MPTIASLHARQILDSRGNPTVEVECTLSDRSLGRAAVPSGVSAGKYEAVEIRDGDMHIYGGKSVLKAVANVKTIIAGQLQGMDIDDQRKIDQALLEIDGTPNKAALGGNALVGVSMAVCCARADSERRPLFLSLADQYGCDDPSLLPVPMAVLIEAGRHSDAGLAFQEFMIMPTGFTRFSDALRAGVETFHTLKKILQKAGHITAVGDEGACAPHLKTNREAIALIVEAIEKAGYKGKIHLALDAAASEFFEDGKYRVDGEMLSQTELTEYYASLSRRYPLLSIEDSHAEDDWEGFTQITRTLGEKVQIVGDDLFVTQTGRIEEGIKRHAANAVLIKLNQVGTVSETVDAIELAKGSGWRTIVSHRGGDTEDTFMAHLAVALRCGQIKTSFNRGERTCKYNELLRIEERLGKRAEYRNPFG